MSDVRVIDVRKNYDELIGMNYGQVKLFKKKFDDNFFAGAGFGRVSYMLGMTNDGLKGFKDETILNDLSLVHGKRVVEMVNSGKAITCSNKAIQWKWTNEGKIQLKQYFPCKERVILKKEDKSGKGYKMLTFPLAVGGYTAWNNNVFIAITPMKIRKGVNVSRLLEKVMESLPESFDQESLEKYIQEASSYYGAEFEMSVLDRKNKNLYGILGKNEKKEWKCTVLVSKGEGDSKLLSGMIGDEKAKERFKDEVFKTEI